MQHALILLKQADGYATPSCKLGPTIEVLVHMVKIPKKEAFMHSLTHPHFPNALFPQAKSLRNELERLDIAFANDLSRLRQTYDTRKAELQAELRGCLDRQPNAAAAVV